MTSQCSLELLESALAGHLPPEEETSLHRHLEECDECSTALERLAGGAEWSRETASLLKGDDLDETVPVRDDWSEVDFTVENLEPSDDPTALGRLGGYDVLEIIGRGGMGVVLKGFDCELKHCVAIKVLAPHLAHSPLAKKRFAREAQAAAAIVHPNVLAIHQVQPNGRLPFLVMPLVAGESLGERLKAQGTLELKEILRIGMQAAAGLAAAHEQGLVHRDVKPANILLEKGVERAVLTDFGLARAADDASITRLGIIAGTPQYMSPEQARGEPLDGRSDLFSLGCVLYEMATGVSPFRADSPMATMRRLVDEAPKSLASQNPELPPWFIGIVDRLLEKDASRRFGSAKEVSELLEGCLAHLQQPTGVPLPAALVVPKPRRVWRPRSLRFTGVLVMIATLGIGLLSFFGLGLTDPSDIAGEWTGQEWGKVVLKKVTDKEYTGTYTDTFGRQPGEISLQWSRIEQRFNGTWREGEDRFGEISIRLVGAEIRGANTTDAKSKINPGTPRLSDLTWIKALVTHDLVKALYPGSSVRDIAISNDGQTLAFGCENKLVSVYDLNTMTLRHTLRGHTSGVWSVAISPDGRTLASTSGTFADTELHEIIIWDLAKGKALRTLKGQDGAAFSLAFSPDGTSLYSGGWGGTVRVWDPTSGKEIGVLIGHKGFVRRVLSSPDGKYIVSCGLDGTVRFWSRESLKEERRLVTNHDGISPATFSPDGKWLITGSRSSGRPDPGIITVWEVATGKEKTTIKGPTRKVTGLAVSPDSKLLAMGGGFHSQFGEVKVFDLATGKVLTVLNGHKEWVGGMAFSPDGRRLVTGSGDTGKAAEVRVWDVENLRNDSVRGSFDASSPPVLVGHIDSSALAHRVPIEVGATYLRNGDRITIDEVRGTAATVKAGNMYEIKGTYRLASRTNATLAVYITDDGTIAKADKTKNDGPTATQLELFQRAIERSYGSPEQKTQSMKVERGEGRFALILYVWYDGKPHVSFYPDGGEGFAHVYFGTGDSVLTKGWWEGPRNQEAETQPKANSADQTGSIGQQSTFGPVFARDVTDMIDLDTGKLAIVPSFEEAHEENWMTRKKMDAAFVAGALTTWDMKVAFTENSAWDRLTPMQLVKLISSIHSNASGNDRLHRGKTYAFQTREGGQGILQVLDFTDEAKNGLKIRYKLLQGKNVPSVTNRSERPRVLVAKQTLFSGSTVSRPDQVMARFVEDSEMDEYLKNDGKHLLPVPEAAMKRVLSRNVPADVPLLNEYFERARPVDPSAADPHRFGPMAGRVDCMSCHAPINGVQSKSAPNRPLILAARYNLFEGLAVAQTEEVIVRPVEDSEIDSYLKNKHKYMPPIPEAAVWRVLARNVPAGEPLLKDYFEDLKLPASFGERLQPGMKGVNLEVPRDRAGGGVIRNNDIVDVWLTTTIQDPSGKISPTTASARIAADLRVIFKRNSIWTMLARDDENKPIPFTLEANAYRAALIEFAKNRGYLTLVPTGPTSSKKKIGVTTAFDGKEEEKRIFNVNNGQSITDRDLADIFKINFSPFVLKIPESPSAGHTSAKKDVVVTFRRNEAFRLRNTKAADILPSVNDHVEKMFIARKLQLTEELRCLIVADPASDTLLITAMPQYMDDILQIISQLDLMPPQTPAEPAKDGANAINFDPANRQGADIIRSNSRVFQIPVGVAVSRSREVKELHLYVSSDEGRTWKLAEKLSPSGDAFRFAAPSDGMYWFNVLVIKNDGTSEPRDPSSSPNLRIQVDTSELKAPNKAPKVASPVSAKIFRFKSSHPIRVIAYSPDGKTLALGGDRPIVSLLDAATGGQTRTLDIFSKEEEQALADAKQALSDVQVTALSYSPEGKTIAVGSSLGQVKFYGAQTGEFLGSLNDLPKEENQLEFARRLGRLRRAHHSVDTIVFSPDGATVATYGDRSITDGPYVGPRLMSLKFWDVKTGALKQRVDGHGGQIFGIGFWPDGTFLAMTAHEAESVFNHALVHSDVQYIVDGRSSKKLTDSLPLGHPPLDKIAKTIAISAGTSVALSPDGKRMAVGSLQLDQANNTESGLISIVFPASGIRDIAWRVPMWRGPLAFSSDGKAIATRSATKAITFWDAATGQRVREVGPSDNDKDVRWETFALSPADELAVAGVASENQGFVEVWRLGR